jgi:hypothetical protein
MSNNNLADKLAGCFEGSIIIDYKHFFRAAKLHCGIFCVFVVLCTDAGHGGHKELLDELGGEKGRELLLLLLLLLCISLQQLCCSFSSIQFSSVVLTISLHAQVCWRNLASRRMVFRRRRPRKWPKRE